MAWSRWQSPVTSYGIVRWSVAQHIEVWTKWLLLCREHMLMHFQGLTDYPKYLHDLLAQLTKCEIFQNVTWNWEENSVKIHLPEWQSQFYLSGAVGQWNECQYLFDMLNPYCVEFILRNIKKYIYISFLKTEILKWLKSFMIILLSNIRILMPGKIVFIRPDLNVWMKPFFPGKASLLYTRLTQPRYAV